MVRILSPLLDELANDLALKIEKVIEKVRQDNAQKEISLLSELAQKHGYELQVKPKCKKI